MNIYLLVEGQSTEADVYPAWMAHLLPELERVDNYDEVEQNNYYLFSSFGIPHVEKDIVNSAEVQRFSYLRELQKRVGDEPSHLGTFVNFMEFCGKIKTEITR